ncbi:hypothetical protein DR74_2973 [Enterobacter cloacae]|nr:hypothetical protein DR74_2973 [Enterobacter cloacae]
MQKIDLILIITNEIVFLSRLKDGFLCLLFICRTQRETQTGTQSIF